MTEIGNDSDRAPSDKSGSLVPWIVLAGLVAGLIWFIAWPLAGFLFWGMRPGEYSEHFFSPARTVDLEACHRPGKGYLLHFIVRNQAGQEIDLIETRASTVMWFGVLWRNEGDFILDSSDIGSRRFRVGIDGRWGSAEDPSRRYSPDNRESVAAYLAEGRIRLSVNEHSWPDKSTSTGGSGISTLIALNDVKPEHSIRLKHGVEILSDCLRWESPDEFSMDLAAHRRFWRRGPNGTWSEVGQSPRPSDSPTGT
jgi:hypothetical protein